MKKKEKNVNQRGYFCKGILIKIEKKIVFFFSVLIKLFFFFFFNFEFLERGGEREVRVCIYAVTN